MNEMLRNNYFIQDWMSHVSKGVKLMFPDINDSELIEYLEKIIDKNLNIPICVLDNNYTKTEKKVDVLSLFQWVRDKEYIIAGNGTIFKNQNQEYNPMIHMLMDLKKSRDRIKSSMKQKTPGTYEYMMDEAGQLNEKLMMNSDYGASGSDITYFFNLYCAASTTATGQSLISTALTTFEDFYCDNVKFIDYDDAMVYINRVIDREYTNDSSILKDRRHDEVFERLKDKFLNYKEEYSYPLFTMLLKLNQLQLNKLYYTNNLYEFCRLPHMKRLLFDIVDKTDSFLNPNKLPEDTKHLIEESWVLIKDFVAYPEFAFNRIGRLKCDERDVVSTVDTDSNMLSLEPWFNFVMDEIIDGNERILTKGTKPLTYMIINLSCYHASQLIKVHLKKFADRSGILPEYAPRLDLKNEYLFKTMLLTDTKKRYMSKILLREGTVFEKYDNKGVDHLKSTCNSFTRDFITNLIATEVLDVETDISVKNVVNGVRELADTVRESLLNGEKTFLSPMKAKDAGAYKNPFQEQSFRGAYAWNVIYPDMQIEFPETIDIVHLNIPTLETIEDMKDTYPVEYEHIKRYIFESKIEEVRKKALTVIGIPKNYASIPEWCKPYIDYDKIIDNNTGKLNSLLNSLGVGIISTSSNSKHFSNIIEF